MKKIYRLKKKTLALVSLCLFITILFGACLDDKFEKLAHQQNNVRIIVGSVNDEDEQLLDEEARALLPKIPMTVAALSRIDLTFTSDGKTPVTGSINDPAANNTFNTTLAAGTWKVSAKGYRFLNGKDYEAARGEASFTVTVSGATCNLNLESGIFKDLTAPGVLSYDITIPGTVSSASINMIPFDDFIKNPNTAGETFDITASANRKGTREYAAGFYWLTVTATNGTGTAKYNEIANIYSGQETPLTHAFVNNADTFKPTVRTLGGTAKLNHSIFYNFSVAPFGSNLSATMTAQTAIGGITIRASTAANMTSAAVSPAVTIDSISFSRRIQIPGSGSSTSRAIQFSVTGPSIIRVYAQRNTSGDASIILSSGTTVIDTKTFTNTASYNDYIYTGVAGTLSIYSSTATATNVYGSKVSPKIGQVLTPVTSDITGVGSDTGFKYQWKADGTNIGSGNGATYTIAGADAGKIITTVITHDAADGSVTATGEKVPYNIAVTRSGSTGTDALTASPEFGFAGETITLNYTVANSGGNNRLQFSGVAAGIETVTAAGTGTRTFTLAATDAANGTITINGTFSHVNLTPNTIAFANTSNETRTYGDASYTKAITNAGNGTGAITYASGTPTVATVNNSGAVTILIPGTTVITATKASDGTYAEATASYTLTINKKDVTITGLTTANKTYDGTPSVPVTGTATISGVLTADSSYVSVTAGTASFNNKNVGTGKAVTFTGYSLSGTRADRYNLSAQPTSANRNITAKALTIGTPGGTKTKVYNGTTEATSAVSVGTLEGAISGDNVSATIQSAVYNSADVLTANTITIVYSLTGTDAANYTKPADGSVAGTITKATGAAITTGQPTVNSKTSTSITVNAATLATATGQSVEYARATSGTTAPTTGWQDLTSFSGLTANTNYYIWARSKSNDNYSTGTARASAVIKTDAADTPPANAIPFTKIDFEADALDKTYSYTNGANSPNPRVLADPSPVTGSSQKSLRMTLSSGEAFNQGVIIPINLPYELKNYSKVTFRFRATTTGDFTSKQVLLYAASQSSTFARYGFGNGADSQYTQFAANLVGTSANVATSTTAWSNNEIIITNPGTAIADLKGNIFIAMGIHNETQLDYWLDDIDFVLKSDFVPPTSNSSISPTTANFNKTVPTDRPVEVTLNGNTLTNIQRGTVTLQLGTGTANLNTGANAYTVSGNTYTIRKEYLNLLSDGSHTFTFNFSAGTAQTLTVTVYTAASGITYFKKIDFQTYNTGTPSDITSTSGSGSATMSIVQDSTNTSTRALQITTSNYNQAAIIPIQLDYPLHNYNKITIRMKPTTGGTALNGKSIQIYAAGSKSDFTAYGFGNEPSETHSMVPRRIAKSATLNFNESPYVNTWTSFELDNLAHTTNDTWCGNLKGPAFIAVGLNVSNSNTVIIIDDIDFQLKPDFVPPPPPPAWTQPPSTGAVATGNYRNLFLDRGLWTQTEITAKVNQTYNRLFTDNETIQVEVGGQNKTTEKYRIYYEVASTTAMGGAGAYILDYNGQNNHSDVRSEGQSYGMMMAVQMNDQTKFDRLWRWAKAYMYNETNVGKNSRGYFAWQVEPTAPYSKIDVGPAPDGEFYFATALLFAHARWGSGSGVLNYRQHAMQLLYDMIHRDTAKGDNHGEPSMIRRDAPGQYMPVFQPQGNAGTFTDPSYHLPSFYEVWVYEMKKDADAGNLHGIWSSVSDMRADITFYENVISTSRSFFGNAIHPTSGLNADYTNFDGTPTGNQNYFGYDAFRTITNIAMDYAWYAKDANQKTYVDRLQTFFHGKGVNTYNALWNWDGTARSDPGDHSPGLVAMNATASLAATNARAWDFIEDFWEIEMTAGRYRYYDGCLYMFGMLHLSGNFKAYLSGGSTTPPTPGNASISPQAATFVTNSGTNVVVTMTPNGRNLTNIQYNGTAVATNNYTISGNTVTILATYLNGLSNAVHTFTFNFDGGTDPTLAITKQAAASNSTISPTTASFTNNNATLATTMTLNGNTLTNITRAGTVVASSNYSISNNVVTFTNAYLKTLPNGSNVLTFNFSAGNTATYTITVSGVVSNSTISPTSATFSKASPATIAVTLTLNGNTFTNVQRSGTTITAGTNTYSITGSASDTTTRTITFTTAYLNGLTNGSHTLTFNFSAGNAATLTLTVAAGSSGGGLQTPPTTGAVTSGVYRNTLAEIGKSQADITARVNQTWTRLFTPTNSNPTASTDYQIYYEMNTPIGPGAYVYDSGSNPPDIRSEGMSYGMMMAVQLDKKEVFDKLWRWARHYMYNTSAQGRNMRGYFSWAMRTDGTVRDLGIAPDGEFYFATALLFAHARWGSNTGTGQTVPGSGSGTDTSARDILDYRYHAMLLLYDMIHRDIQGGKDPYSCTGLFRRPGDAGDNKPEGYYMPVFSPYGNSQNHTDPSYHLPAFYEVWAYEMEKDVDAGILHGVWSSASQMREDVTFYKTAASTSRDFFAKAMHGTTGLNPDYSLFDGSPTGGQPYFGYDAFRTVMNLSVDGAWWAKDLTRQTTLANRLLTFFYGKGVTTYKGLWNVDGTAYSNPGDHSPGLIAMNAAASLVATYANTTDFINDFWDISMTAGQYRYYDGCLYMLGLLNVSGNFRAYLSSGTYVQNPSITPTTATFDKRTGQGADIVVTINNLGTNSLSNIKNGSTTLTSGSSGNYTISGSTVTIRTSYLSTLAVGNVSLTFNFSDGSSKTLAISVIQSTEGGGGTGGGTEFDFATASPTMTVNGTITADSSGSVLVVTKTGGYSTPTWGLTFSLGSKTLGQFSSISVFTKKIEGDTDHKSFIARVGGTQVGTVSPGAISTSGFTEIIVPLSTSLTQTGDVLITFEFNNTNPYVINVQKIKLNP